jgi:PBP1b-binding outer membrane lipoprotein LpoB
MKSVGKWILIALSVFVLFSCASAPPEEQTPQKEPAAVEEPAAPADRTAVDAAKVSADQAKIKADQVKASKAVPQEYSQAVNLYAEAEKSDKAGDLEAARSGYDKAASAFLAAAASAEKAREAALAALSEADKAIADTESAAEQAYQEAAGGNQ